MGKKKRYVGKKKTYVGTYYTYGNSVSSILLGIIGKLDYEYKRFMFNDYYQRKNNNNVREKKLSVGFVN